MGHHQDAKRAHNRIVPGHGGGIGSAALVDQAAQRALLGGGQRLVVGALSVPGGLEGSAGVLGGDTSQEMTRSLSSRKVLRTISVADWNFVQNPLRWSLVG